MKILLQSFLFAFVFINMTSCFDLPPGETGTGLAPIYISPDDFSFISSTEPREANDQGSFFFADDFYYINERFRGIHVFDNTVPSDPVKIYFWNIPGNTEFSVEGDLLYADNSRHLITIDISDKADIKYVSHVEDVYTGDNQNNNFPENYRGIFECVDFEKGIVVDWEQKEFFQDADCEIF
jgi:hypothetical protein